MTRILAALVISASLAVLLRTLRKRPEPVDEMAQPFLDSDWTQQGRNSATYLYNAATGVIVSQN